MIKIINYSDKKRKNILVKSQQILNRAAKIWITRCSEWGWMVGKSNVDENLGLYFRI